MNRWLLLPLVPGGLLFLGCLFFTRRFFLWLGISLLRRFSQWLTGVAGTLTQDRYFKFLVKLGNGYFLKGFKETPYHLRLLFLPFCLCPAGCQGQIDPHQGILCRSDCPDCKLGHLRDEAKQLGYAGVYVVPSSRCLRRSDLMPSDIFIKDKLNHHEARALIGVTCSWYLKTRLLPKYTIKKEGYLTEGRGSGYLLQGILLPQRKCTNATVDWEKLLARLRLKA